MRLFSHPRFLVVYSMVVTAAFAATVLAGVFGGGWTMRRVMAGEQPKNAEFDQITVRRINVVEPDGTMRLVISGKGEFPGTMFRSKEGRRSDRGSAAGMLFMNDEGTENGGMLFGGYKGKDGAPHSWGHLSFDEYEQDQTLSLDTEQDSEQRRKAGVRIFDNGAGHITPEVMDAFEKVKSLPAKTPEEQAAAQKAFAELLAKYPIRENMRAYLGSEYDKGSVLRLKDAQGHDRIVLRVAADGTPTMQFLDAAGKAVHQWPEK